MIQINNRDIAVAGKWIRVASFQDEPFLDGDLVEKPATFLKALKVASPKIDIFTFPQKIYEGDPQHDFFFEWDNAAVISTTDYNDWWENKLPQEARKNTRRAAKRGVTVQIAEFNDDLVRGIKSIYDECEFRQGRKFWHYGKDFDSVKRENATYLDRSQFLGAYHQGELIGFMKVVSVNKSARMMQILAKNEHQDKRPMNALISKAVELCHQNGMQFLIYGKFNYGNKQNSPLTEFKRRNGFEEMRFPRYYIPLTLKGKIVLKLNLHRNLIDQLPPWLIKALWRLRANLIKIKSKSKTSARNVPLVNVGGKLG